MGTSLLEFFASAGNGVEPDRAQRDGCRGEWTILLGRSVTGRSPCAIRELINGEIVNMGVGQGIGRIAGGRHSHERITERVRASANRRARAHRFKVRRVGGHCESQLLFGLFFVDHESLLAR